jgi:hypothetical protein
LGEGRKGKMSNSTSYGSLVMSAAAYGMEIIWRDQKWVLKGFERLTHSIAKAVAGTFSTTMAEDTIRAADTHHTDGASS